MNEKHERRLRRKALRLTLQGLRPQEILQRIPRSRSWLFKWQTRFQNGGGTALASRPRRPGHTPQQYAPPVRRLVLQVRRTLGRRRVGLIGAKQIQREVRQSQLARRVPSPATIYRILHEGGVFKAPRPLPEVYFPQPTATPLYPLQAMDWTSRYLEGGQKVYAFHTLDLTTRALQQTISTNKTTATVLGHLLEVWQTLGLPAALQLDNDAAFCGGYKAPRVFGQFVRLCLFVGLELLFLPFGEPERNGVIDRLNGLWSQAFWRRHRFRSVAEVRRASPQFTAWYAQTYQPPTLTGQTPVRVHPPGPRMRLTAGHLHLLRLHLDHLPLTAGRIHFLRLVDPDGLITLLNEPWPISKRLAGHYVWATLRPQAQRLEIYHRPSAQAPGRLLKVFPYPLHKPVVPLLPQFKRPYRRRKVCTML
jgi:transposase